jgi:hypothetical protein
MKLDVKEFINDGFHIKIQDNICYVTFLKDFYSENEIDFAIKKRIELYDGKIYPMISDISNIRDGTREAKMRLSLNDGYIGVNAIAIIFSNKIHLALYRTYLTYHNIQIPHKLFTVKNKDKAKEWIVKQNVQVKTENELVLFKNDAFLLKIENNIVNLIWLKQHYNYEDIDFMIKKKAELLDRPYPAISDIRKVKSGTREANMRLRQSDGDEKIIAMAIICKTKVQQIFFSFYLQFNSKTIPRKSFIDETNAINWLNKFKLSS